MKTFLVPFNVKTIGSVLIAAETVEEAAAKVEAIPTDELVEQHGEETTRNVLRPEEQLPP